MSPRAGLSTQAVVDAAAQLSDAEGLAALTLARVAQHVGVRTPSLYSHVGGLDDLRRLLALRAVREAGAALAAATVGLAGDDAVRALGRAYRAYALAHPGRYAAIVRAPDPQDTELAQAAAAVVDIITAALRGYGLRGDDAIHAVRALRAALHGFASLEAAGGFGLPLDVDDSFERLLDLLVRGLRPDR